MNGSARQLLQNAVDLNASDIFLISGMPIAFKLSGVIETQAGGRLSPSDTEVLLREIYDMAGGREIGQFLKAGDDDFSFALAGVSRFRVSTYKQRGSLAAVIRVVTFDLPDPGELGIPPTVLQLAHRPKGLVLVTGPAGSGKSTTLACMIDEINKTSHKHVITLEDPLEYLHSHKQSIVSQREVFTDTNSYVHALRAALRQAPDVILLGEMRDHETITVAMTAAETGHLIISTLHTIGAANTIDRVIDAFPPSQQQQIRIQLSMVLQAVISQQLIPTVDDKMAVVFEIMLVNSAVRNMIRESKVHQLDTVIYSSAGEGMLAMDASILKLFKAGVVSERDALAFASNADTLQKKMRQ
ncbi:MAG: PilT/PilU family type 4a pilus ATPase [Gracilibacteraceae bacterium]|jgi:twitching motility protein PilT|nr:PilT/PilU family type 4a pilus ATPase [Gracilibacteraceae bacterium]